MEGVRSWGTVWATRKNLETPWAQVPAPIASPWNFTAIESKLLIVVLQISQHIQRQNKSSQRPLMQLRRDSFQLPVDDIAPQGSSVAYLVQLKQFKPICNLFKGRATLHLHYHAKWRSEIRYWNSHPLRGCMPQLVKSKWFIRGDCDQRYVCIHLQHNWWPIAQQNLRTRKYTAKCAVFSWWFTPLYFRGRLETNDNQSQLERIVKPGY